MSRIGRVAYPLYRLVWGCVDLLYPPRCCGCGAPNVRLCDDCKVSITLIEAPICERCGRMIPRRGQCLRCRTNPPQFIAHRSWCMYEGAIRKAIHRLKYYGDIALGDLLTRPLITLLSELNWEIDSIVAVPVTKSRAKERGYNQAALLAYPISLSAEIVFQPESLIKTRQVPSQVGLTLEQRIKNVAGVFEAIPVLVRGKKLLIIDDVITSGATMNACATALLDAGARSVYGLTLARAGFKS